MVFNAVSDYYTSPTMCFAVRVVGQVGAKPMEFDITVSGTVSFGNKKSINFVLFYE